MAGDFLFFAGIALACAVPGVLEHRALRPFARFFPGDARQAVLSAAIQAELIGFIAAVLTRAVFGTAAGVAVVLVVVAIAYRTTFTGDLRRLDRVARAVKANDVDRALALADSMVERASRHRTNYRFALMLLATLCITAAGRRVALAFLETLLARERHEAVKIRLEHLRIDLLLSEKELDEAERRLAETPEADSEATKGERALLETKLALARGLSEEALERAEGRVGLPWEIVRAHALATLGRRDEARDVLANVRVANKDAFVEVVSALGEGAVPLAASMDRSSGAYR